MIHAACTAFFVGLGLLTAIPTASADGVWVLWGESYPPVKEFLFLPVDAFATREECLWEKDRRAETMKADLKEGRTPDVVVSVCLPDNISPCEPPVK